MATPKQTCPATAASAEELFCMFTRKTKSAGGVVLNPNGGVLVVKQHGDSWSLPKGHIDEGETPLEAAKREIFEESGITDLTLVKPLFSYERFAIGPGGVGEDRSMLKEIEMFLFRTSQTKLTPQDSANPEARWVLKNEVSKLLTHPKDREFFEKITFELP